MGAQLNYPTRVKASKKRNFEILNIQNQVRKADKALKHIVASHAKLVSVMAQKQSFFEKQGQTASLRKLQK